MTTETEILLFSHDTAYATRAVAAGIDRVIVDWESRGKAERQARWNTQINCASSNDLRAMRDAVGERVICRINNIPGERVAECRLAVDNGAAEVWLPMVRDIAEIEECLVALDGRARLGLMVETREAMRLGRELAQLPLSRAYIGLHDYYIDGGSRGLFDPITDGTLDQFREDYPGAFGFAGVTRPAGGSPIPQRLLLAAMVRLGCAFGVARRGFLAAVPMADLDAAVLELTREIARLQLRPAGQVARDHAALLALIDHISTRPRSRLDVECVP
jgi:hypothetical protein